MTLVTWRGVNRRNIPTQGVKSTSTPMFESVLNGFCSKEAPFIFLPLTYNGASRFSTTCFVGTKVSNYLDVLISMLSSGHKIDLTLGHRYRNSEIYIL